MRFSRLRPCAKRQCFFEIASPRRALPVPFAFDNTVKKASRLFPAPRNTRLKAAASGSRLVLANRWRRLFCLFSGPLCVSVVVARSAESYIVHRRFTGGCYGASCARPFARRLFRICRPALVAMRARNPWFRARLSLLGWKVRFMCLACLVLPRRNAPAKRKPARVRGAPNPVNRPPARRFVARGGRASRQFQDVRRGGRRSRANRQTTRTVSAPFGRVAKGKRTL